jgi:protease I
MALSEKRIAMLVDDGFEDLEFWVPLIRMEEGGAAVTVVGTKAGRVVHSKSGGLTASIDADASEVSAGDFDAILVPGGWAPDKLRRSEAVTGLVRAMYDEGKIVAMICHAGLVGISAGIVKGRRATGSLGIRDDLVNAGATWVDAPAFRDGNLVWGRVVPDIPAYCRELVEALGEN